MQTLPIDLKNELDRLMAISKASLSMLVSRLDLADAETDLINRAAITLDNLIILEKKLLATYQ